MQLKIVGKNINGKLNCKLTTDKPLFDLVLQHLISGCVKRQEWHDEIKKNLQLLP